MYLSSHNLDFMLLPTTEAYFSASEVALILWKNITSIMVFQRIPASGCPII